MSIKTCVFLIVAGGVERHRADGEAESCKRHPDARGCAPCIPSCRSWRRDHILNDCSRRSCLTQAGCRTVPRPAGAEETARTWRRTGGAICRYFHQPRSQLQHQGLSFNGSWPPHVWDINLHLSAFPRVLKSPGFFPLALESPGKSVWSWKVLEIKT